MKGKLCVITGATGGIGRTTALELARQGADLVLVGRDPERAKELLEAVHAAAGSQGGKAETMLCDFSSQAEIRRLAAELKQKHPRIDVLINIAGGIFTERRTTVDGYEWTFAVNHLGYFLLTNLLLDVVKERIVSVSSGAHYQGRIDFDDLMSEKRYATMRAYSQSKLANVLFTRELARRLSGTGVTANCVHPGFVDSQFGHQGALWLRLGLTITRPFMRSVEKGADTLVYLASSPEVAGISGEYFMDRKVRRGSPASRDPETAKKLWEVSEKLTGLTA